MRADVALVARGLARSRRQAAELIHAGLVRTGPPASRLVAKPSMPISPSVALLLTDAGPQLASRAGSKLDRALHQLTAQQPALGQRIHAAIRTERGCLDIGASTGGFTDVLLRAGAQRVIALDVGHGQLRSELRTDSRVTVLEHTNIRDIDLPALTRKARCDPAWPGPGLIVGDLSFISLTLVVPIIAALQQPGDLALLLIKPQFEVGREQLGRDGIVRSEAVAQRAVASVISAAAAVGLAKLAVLPSPIVGTHGNQEYFGLFERTDLNPSARTLP